MVCQGEVDAVRPVASDEDLDGAVALGVEDVGEVGLGVGGGADQEHAQGQGGRDPGRSGASRHWA